MPAGSCPFTIDRPAMTQRWERLTFLHWSADPAVVQRNLDTVRSLSHVLLTAFGDSCPPPEDGEGAR